MSLAPPYLVRLREWIHAPCTRLQRFARYSSSGGSLPRPRLNYRDIAENVEAKTRNVIVRKAGVLPDTARRVSELYRETTLLSRTVDNLRAQRASLGHAVRQARSGEERIAAIARAAEAKENLRALEKDLEAKDEQLYLLASSIPNDTHPSAPSGPESAARIVSHHGPSPVPSDPLRDHVSVAKSLDMLDMESAATVTGSSWYFLRNEGALLELALTNYAISMAIQAGFSPVTTPDVVKADIAHRSGFHPRDEVSSQNYYLHTKDGGDRHVLAGTAEIPLAGMFAQRVIPEKDLPIRVVGLGRAFRAEAGARGADTRGLYRVHQFTKVELFTVTRGEDSEAMIESLVELQKRIFDGLSIPYKVLEMPSEELGASAYMKYDIEAWMPGRGAWGEISSTSNCTDYQARRLHITYNPTRTIPDKPTRQAFAHTLNGTAAAIPRLIVALLENGAILEGSRVVGLNLPKALEPFWLGTDRDRFRFV